MVILTGMSDMDYRKREDLDSDRLDDNSPSKIDRMHKACAYVITRLNGNPFHEDAAYFCRENGILHDEFVEFYNREHCAVVSRRAK